MIRKNFILALVLSMACFKSYSLEFHLGNIDEQDIIVSDSSFWELFKKDSVLKFKDVLVTEGQRSIYWLRAPNGEVRIEKKSENQFSFYMTD